VLFDKVPMISRVIDGLVALTGISWSQRNFQFHTNQLSSNLISKLFSKTTLQNNIFYYFLQRAPNDTSNFSSYPESDTHSPALKPADDPFLEW